MSDTFGLSLLQHVPRPLAVDAAVQRIDAAARDAAAAGSALLLMPEASVTGYNIAEAAAARVALPLDGNIAKRIASVARARRIAILWATIELDADGERRWNAAILVDREGAVRLHYRKAHLWGELDRRLFAAGESLGPVIELDGWRIASCICYDVEFPETVRTLALAGAELVLVPTALMRPYRFVAETVVATRAYENQVFLAYANYCGAENDLVYEGRSSIHAPDGRSLATAPPDAPVLLHAKLSRATLVRARAELPYLRDRRPALYRSDAGGLPQT